MQESISKGDEIKSKLDEFESNIDDYRLSLNTEGVWLFLATLGCWSVTDGWIKMFAMVIVALLFSHRIYTKVHDKRSFPKIYRDLEAAIYSEIDVEEARKARLYDLSRIKLEKLSVLNSLKSTTIFIVCYLFLVVTILDWHRTFFLRKR